MGLDEKTMEFAKSVFRKAKVSRRSIDNDLKEVGQLIGYEPTVGQSFLGGLYEIVRSNGAKLNELQVRYLLRGEERLKLPRGIVQSWIRGGYAPPQFNPNDENALTLEEAYDALGISKTVSDKEVKTAYRGKAAEFHPDKLKSKNLPMNSSLLQRSVPALTKTRSFKGPWNLVSFCVQDPLCSRHDDGFGWALRGKHVSFLFEFLSFVIFNSIKVTKNSLSLISFLVMKSLSFYLKLVRSFLIFASAQELPSWSWFQMIMDKNGSQRLGSMTNTGRKTQRSPCWG